MLFRSWNDIFKSGIRGSDADIYSFNNRNIFNDIIWPQKVIWHGAGTAGERRPDAYCEAWSSSDPSSQGMASSLNIIGGSGSKRIHLLSQEMFSCQNRFVVLCVEATSGNSGFSRINKRSTNTLDYNSFVSEEHYQSHLQSLV